MSIQYLRRSMLWLLKSKLADVSARHCSTFWNDARRESPDMRAGRSFVLMIGVLKKPLKLYAHSMIAVLLSKDRLVPENPILAHVSSPRSWLMVNVLVSRVTVIQPSTIFLSVLHTLAGNKVLKRTLRVQNVRVTHWMSSVLLLRKMQIYLQSSHQPV